MVGSQLGQVDRGPGHARLENRPGVAGRPKAAGYLGELLSKLRARRRTCAEIFERGHTGDPQAPPCLQRYQRHFWVGRGKELAADIYGMSCNKPGFLAFLTKTKVWLPLPPGRHQLELHSGCPCDSLPLSPLPPVGASLSPQPPARSVRPLLVCFKVKDVSLLGPY